MLRDLWLIMKHNIQGGAPGSCLPEQPGNSAESREPWSSAGMVWGEKGDPGSLPGRLRTKEPPVPVKELGHSGLIISFHTDY